MNKMRMAFKSRKLCNNNDDCGRLNNNNDSCRNKNFKAAINDNYESRNFKATTRIFFKAAARIFSLLLILGMFTQTLTLTGAKGSAVRKRAEVNNEYYYSFGFIRKYH